MLNQIIFAGFGGQGILTAGLLLANTGSMCGKEIIWMPSYGSEMRGGTANCSVKVSDEAISSPFIKKADYLVVMNKPSLDKFLPQVREGGTIIIDSSIVTDIPDIPGQTVIAIPANDICEKLKNARGANICMLGALAGCSSLFTEEQYEVGIKDYFSGKPQFHENNMAAFHAGCNYVKAG